MQITDPKKQLPFYSRKPYYMEIFGSMKKDTVDTSTITLKVFNIFLSVYGNFQHDCENSLGTQRNSFSRHVDLFWGFRIEGSSFESGVW